MLSKDTTRILLLGFLITFISFVSCQAKAETAFEGGITVLNDKYSGGGTFIYAERWNKWNAGIGWLGPQTDKYDRHINNNLLVFGERLVHGPGVFRAVELGLGLAFIEHKTTVNGSNLNYMLSLKYYKPRQSLIPDYFIYRHISNGGAHPPNTGQNMINVGYSFE